MVKNMVEYKACGGRALRITFRFRVTMLILLLAGGVEE